MRADDDCKCGHANLSHGLWWETIHGEYRRACGECLCFNYFPAARLAAVSPAASEAQAPASDSMVNEGKAK